MLLCELVLIDCVISNYGFCSSNENRLWIYWLCDIVIETESVKLGIGENMISKSQDLFRFVCELGCLFLPFAMLSFQFSTYCFWYWWYKKMEVKTPRKTVSVTNQKK